LYGSEHFQKTLALGLIFRHPASPEREVAMNVRLEKSWQDYVEKQVEAGRFDSASDVVQDALQRQMEYFAKRETLRGDLLAGLASIQAGRLSQATAEDIKRLAADRKKSA
jgi:putative addiction module CopG family antidote